MPGFGAPPRRPCHRSGACTVEMPPAESIHGSRRPSSWSPEPFRERVIARRSSPTGEGLQMKSPTVHSASGSR